MSSAGGGGAKRRRWFVRIFLLHGISDDASHYGADESQTHDDDDFTALFALGGDNLLQAFEFFLIIFRQRQRKCLAVRRDRENFFLICTLLC